MSDSDIYDKWTKFINEPKYKQYFISNNEEWYQKFEEVKKYIDINNKRPSNKNKDKNIKILGTWIQTQQDYRKKNRLMSDQTIYKKWTEFINEPKYKQYFISNNEEWYQKFEEVKKYIDINNKQPSSESECTTIKKLSCWINHTKENYKYIKHIMKNEEIYNLWTEFISDPKYKVYFESNEDSWIKTLNELKLYIDTNNIIPLRTDKNEQIKVHGVWIETQHHKYKVKKGIMKNEEIYNLWTEFINDPKYKKYF
jgi:antitoxin component HigA of HigAB toxin-antitoxin module